MAYAHVMKIQNLDKCDWHNRPEEYKKWSRFIADLCSKLGKWDDEDVMPILEENFNIIGVKTFVYRRIVKLKVTFKTRQDFMMFKLKML